MIQTIKEPSELKESLKETPYYSDGGWKLFSSVRNDLLVILSFLRKMGFEAYWLSEVRPLVVRRIAEVEEKLPNLDVVPIVEQHLGYRLASNKITVYMLYFSQPHGIRITGNRYLTDVAWDFGIVQRNAVHELMHPPYNIRTDDKLRSALQKLGSDEYLIAKVRDHDPSFGYNSVEGLIEEDVVQAVEQLINERLGTAVDAKRRWLESDGGIHVLAAVLYSRMKAEGFPAKGDSLRDFLLRQIDQMKIYPGRIKPLYEDFLKEGAAAKQ